MNFALPPRLNLRRELSPAREQRKGAMIDTEPQEARSLVDEISLHIAPVLLGDGIRFYDNPGRAADPAPAR